MARAAHPDSMKPSTPGATRTAPPMLPHQFPMTGRYKAYTLFDATGLVYLLAGFVALRAVRALVAGPAAWAAFQQDLSVFIDQDQHLKALLCNFQTRSWRWKQGRRVTSECLTVFLQWAKTTCRFATRTQRRPKIHDCLAVIRTPVFG